MPKIQFEESIVREGWSSAFRLATERAWLRAGLEVERSLLQLPAGTKVRAVHFSWTELAVHSTHAVWVAVVELELADGRKEGV